MKKQLTLFLFLLPGLLMSEEIPYPELKNLFNADVVVDATVKSQDESKFYINVNEVIVDRGFGLKKGDQINLPREDDGCGFEVDFMHYKRRRFYLKKYENGWHLNYGSIQSIKPVHKFGSLLIQNKFCGLSHKNPPDVPKMLNGFLNEFANAYRFNSESYSYVPILKNKSLARLVDENPIVKAFEQRGRCCVGEGFEEVVEVEPVNVIEEGPLPVIACELAYKKPEGPMSQDELNEYLIQTKNPMSEYGIMGRVYVRFVVNEHGELDSLSVVKGLHSTLDSIALVKTGQLTYWSPATDQLGRKRNCYGILPYTFIIEEGQ